MSNSSATASARVGPGFLGLLTLVLVAGKLFAPEVATYSWLVAFAPILFGVAIVVVFLLCMVALWISDERSRKKIRKRNKPTRTL